MTDWKTTKCTKCDHHNTCRKKSISKGSEFCQINLKIMEPRPVDSTSNQSIFSALMWKFMGQRFKKPKEKEEKTIDATKNLNKEENIKNN